MPREFTFPLGDPSEPIAITLGDERFVLLGDAPASAFRELGGRAGTAAQLQFLRDCIEDEADKERWDKLIDGNRRITAFVIRDVFESVYEEYLEFPTKQPAS